MARVTVEMLRALRACEEHRDRFASRWPDGVEVTPETLREAHAMGLEVAWLARSAAPPDVLAALAADEDSGVRRFVVGNHSTPPDVLAALADDADADVRWRVAYHLATPPDVLAALAGDAHSDVRWCVARNPDTPPEALAVLAGDANEDVRRTARGRLGGAA